MSADDDQDDRPLGPALRALVDLPWPLKRWIAGGPRRWRIFSGLCRRAGWNATALGWHTPRNGPYRGLRLRATHVNQLDVPTGLYEPWVSLWLVRLLARRAGPPAPEVWDVGAYAGTLSLLCARHGAGRVTAIEPFEDNLAMLREQLAANPAHGPRVEVIAAAIAAADGEVAYRVRASGLEGQIVAPGVLGHAAPPGEAREGRVAARSLDSLVAEGRPAPDLIKIDVEGAEALVLGGAARLLAEHRPAVVLEVHDAAASREALARLAAASYTVSRIAGRRLRAWAGEPVSYGHVLALPDRRRGESARATSARA